MAWGRIYHSTKYIYINETIFYVILKKNDFGRFPDDHLYDWGVSESDRDINNMFLIVMSLHL